MSGWSRVVIWPNQPPLPFTTATIIPPLPSMAVIGLATGLNNYCSPRHITPLAVRLRLPLGWLSSLVDYVSNSLTILAWRGHYPLVIDFAGYYAYAHYLVAAAIARAE